MTARRRYVLDPDRSCVWVDARSNLHPIRTQTRGVEGWVSLALDPQGTVDLTSPVDGLVHIAVDRFSSGNQLYDRELRRRIDARTYPLITGRLTGMRAGEAPGRVEVSGDLTFHGQTRSFVDTMTITGDGEGGLTLRGERTFDIREFRLTPPSMLMVKVYPEVAVRVELCGTATSSKPWC